MQVSDHPLLTLPDREIGAYYEERVLAGSSHEASAEMLGQAYRALSSKLNEGASSPSGLILPESPESRLIWLLVYGFRTVLVARRLLAQYPPPAANPFVELGSGSGPFGLVASAMGLEVKLVDVSRPALESAREFYASFGLKAPAVVCGDARQHKTANATYAIPYAAAEWGDTEAGMRDLIARARSGRTYLVEHGTKRGAAIIRTVRDKASSKVVAPCPRRKFCPMNERPDDWCHFTWRVEVGPLTKRVSASAGRHWTKLHMSYAVFGSEEPRKRSARVLSVRHIGKQKGVLDLCTTSGLERLVVLRRHRETYNQLTSMESGALLDVDLPAHEKKGDGYRVEDGSTVSVVDEGQRST